MAEPHVSITPYQVAGRETWAVPFTHPSKGRRNRNLGTSQQTDAKAKALDLERIVNDPSIWDAKEDDERLSDFDPRAVECFFDFLPKPKTAKTTVSPEQAETLEAAIAVLPELQKHPLAATGKIKFHIASPEQNKAREREANKDRIIARLEKEKADLAAQNSDYYRKLNKHCKTTLAQALERFPEHYTGRSNHTQSEVIAVVTHFSNYSTGGKQLGDLLLGAIRSAHINNWIAEYQGRGEEPAGVTQTTKSKYRRYLSTFWSWAYRHYDLSENPIQKALPVTGSAPEHIVAIRRYDDLKSLIDGLEDWPYWKAWVAFAVLAGPRFMEQARLKVRDVFITSNYVRITSQARGRRLKGTKTGKERNVPIEKTLLLPILKEHIKTLDGNSPWLFPSVAEPPANEKQDRGGLWCNETFLKYWRGRKLKNRKPFEGIAEKARARAKSDDDYWGYTQMDWRRTAATAMGHAGLSALQISQFIGDSEDIARRHYIAPVGAKLWPLKYS